MSCLLDSGCGIIKAKKSKGAKSYAYIYNFVVPAGYAFYITPRFGIRYPEGANMVLCRGFKGKAGVCQGLSPEIPAF